MNEIKIQGIVLKLSDYKDADKLASIFSLQHGVITAKFTGVKRDKAKFKSIAQPFVFAEFTLTAKNGLKTVTSASVIDSFYNILTNYNKTICGYIVLDVLKSILPIEKAEPDLFLLTVNALKSIEIENEFIATIDYLLKFLTFSGVGLEFFDTDYVYLDTLSGNFTTKRTNDCIAIDKRVYLTLKNIAKNGLKVEEIAETTAKQILRLLHNIIYLKFNEDVKSFSFL